MPVLNRCRAVLLATSLPAVAQATPMDRFVAVVEAVDHRMQEAVGHVALVRAMIDLCRPEAGGAR